MADVGMAIERAENKTETMRARAGAIDELHRVRAPSPTSPTAATPSTASSSSSRCGRRRRRARAAEAPSSAPARRRRPARSGAGGGRSRDRPHPRARASTGWTTSPSRRRTPSTTGFRPPPTPATRRPSTAALQRAGRRSSVGAARRSRSTSSIGSDAIVPGPRHDAGGGARAALLRGAHPRLIAANGATAPAGPRTPAASPGAWRAHSSRWSIQAEDGAAWAPSARRETAGDGRDHRCSR